MSDINLNRNQEKAVFYDGDKPLSIKAGPGSGKTRVLIERIKFLLNDKNVNPESLLVITFTRKAANELKDRLKKDNIPQEIIEKMQISTIHSFCSKIIEKSGRIGLNILGDDNDEKRQLFIIKHLKDLGFVNEFYLPKSEVKDLMGKYDEFCTFDVNIDELTDYIEDNYPIEQKYIDYVTDFMDENDGHFPSYEIRDVDDDEIESSWINAKYLQIARSYPKYLELMENENVIDYNHLQVETLNYLKEHPETVYKNILIDEFQDTDPIQVQIFEILMEQADSFTVVGDIYQSIYGFRGSTENYYDYLFDEGNVEKLELDVNYRSTENIIDFTDKLIDSQRVDDSVKSKCIRHEANNDIYYIYSEDNNEEAENIFKIVKYLKDNNKVENYNDIGILSYSVKSGCFSALIEKFEENNIPFQVKGRNDLLNNDEIKSVLTILYHLAQEDNVHSPVFTGWERDWLNLKAYTGENFNQCLFDLSDETKKILNDVQDEFEENAVSTANKLFGTKKRKFSGIFSFNDEEKRELFENIERPVLSNENIERYGIKNSDDLNFFYRLNDLKDRINAENYIDRPRILNVYLEILTDLTGYLNFDFASNHDNISKLKNIAIISNTFKNYDEMMYSKDFKGAFWFLYRNIKEYDSLNENEHGVQIMTIHKSKGLEFPVTIISGLREGSFPKAFKSKKDSNYYTPYEFLNYKHYNNEEEEKQDYDLEQLRVLYVGMTRAKDTLILSSSERKSKKNREKVNDFKNILNTENKELMNQKLSSIIKGPKVIDELINGNMNYCTPLQKNLSIPEIRCEPASIENEPVKLSFTAIEDYLTCPFKYYLIHELGFRKSSNYSMDEGILLHKCFEIINKKIRQNNNQYIGDDEVVETFNNIYSNTSLDLNIKNGEDENSKKQSIITNLIYYYNRYGLNFDVLDAELPFNIIKEDYNLTGVIDLIYLNKNDGRLGILDYKNTWSKNKYIEKYYMQLYTYVLAIKDNPNFNNYDLNKLSIYAVKAKNLIDIKFDYGKLGDYQNLIDSIANNIINKNFKCNRENCRDCEFIKICNK